jgi:predicted nucleic acid-binding protein
VACAIAGGADYVVTADEDLLVLGELAGLRFVTPSSFVNELASAPKSADPPV